ncbi:MAG: hypothetical protein ACK4K7_03200 [Allosphingosinicella sp.]|uniref:hypothetical protein n=1 Tax=Allosphingosinicella sp. TaxID=2823234 RepID=UPI00391FE793
MTVPDPHLARAARLEAEARERGYPPMVKAGHMTAEEAERDWRCWLVIAEWLARGTARALDWAGDYGWPDLELAAAKALRRREDACAAKPADEGLTARRDAVAAILTAVQARRRFIDDLNAALRRHAEQEAA